LGLAFVAHPFKQSADFNLGSGKGVVIQLAPSRTIGADQLVTRAAIAKLHTDRRGRADDPTLTIHDCHPQVVWVEAAGLAGDAYAIFSSMSQSMAGDFVDEFVS
jgi:hypothetical protein